MNVPLCNLILGVTGSAAALKVPLLTKSILDVPTSETCRQFKIYVIATRAAKRFFKKEDLPKEVTLYDDKLGMKVWRRQGDPVLHIDLTEQSQMLVLAPLDANTMAKITQGLCDNLLTTLIRAWNLDKPVIFCPAMNPVMWVHPVTDIQRNMLKEWGYIEIPPVSKKLTCGAIGVGGMAEIKTIVETIIKVAKEKTGLCDNLLTTVVRSWKRHKPVLFCPSMGTNMWKHPITARHISVLKEWGFKEVPPVSKKLICGSVGIGAMAEIETIVDAIVKTSQEEDPIKNV